MFTLLREENDLAPDSLLLSECFFDTIRKICHNMKADDNCYREMERMSVLLDERNYHSLYLPWEIRQIDETELKKRMQILVDQYQKIPQKSALLQLPGEYPELLKQLAAGYLAGNPDTIYPAYLGLVGAGIGLTPSCDDAMVGVLAVLSVWLSCQDRGQESFYRLSGQLLDDLKKTKRTTAVSIKYLKNAIRGSFVQPLNRIVKWVMTGCACQTAEEVLHMTAIGHSSGVDTLYGVLTGLKMLTDWRLTADNGIKRR